MTDRVALIGRPLRRRHSEVMHNAAFEHYRIDAHYELRDIGPPDLSAFFAEVREPGWLGFQVTAPHKQAVIEYLDRVEDVEVGAVNSGVREANGTLVGFNTDASGFAAAVESDLGVSLHGVRAVVVGAGGAARAVVYALLTGGADSVVVANRTEERAASIARDFIDLGEVRTAGLHGAAFEGHLGEAGLAVNATTVGMTTDTVSFDVALLGEDASVFDLVYVPPDTPLVRAATRRGLRVANGLEMLVRQAETAFGRWTGIPDAGAVMKSALTRWVADGSSDGA
ncbi:shikimate dehydrogenase [soil metagenome]